jgi:tetratricopeptide (TPR) repeat protein
MTLRLLSLLGLGVLLGGSLTSASEPAQAFLEGLRERGYYDTALDYLQSAEQNPAVSEAFKSTLVFERGVTLVAGARLQRDSALREQQLDEAQKILQQYIASQPGSLYAFSARSQLGNVMAERARARLEKSKKLAPNEKTPVLKQSRDLYGQANKEFAALVEELRAKLKTYPAALDEKKEAKKIEERDRYRQDFLQAQLLVAATKEELADTLNKGSKEWTAALTAAADTYKKIFEDYRTRIAGLYARMYQGRCYQKLGKHKEAIAFFNELLANPDSPEFRALRIKVMSLAVDSWLAQELYPEVLDKVVKVIDSARPSEDKTDDLMHLRVATARACKEYADRLKKKNAKDPNIRKLLRDGRALVTYASKFPGEEQDAARRLLPEFAAGEVDAAGARPQPKTFVEARNAAKQAIDDMQSAGILVKTLPTRMLGLKGNDLAEVKKQLDDAKQQVAQNQDDAMEFCRLALKLTDSETDLNDINLVRYLLCYLLYGEKNYYDAIVMGEFLARRYPDSVGARPCAKIVLASFVNLYAQNQTDDKDFETSQIESIADYIVKKWPDQPESDEALNTLIPFMIRAKKLDQAQAYLARIPPDSPQRGSAELKTGQALWASYLENSRQLRAWQDGSDPPPEGFDAAAEQKELEVLKAKAGSTLSDGVERMRKSGEISRILATAVLSLAQIYVDTNEAKKAVTLLEDPKIGVLTLVENNDPAASDDAVAEETYKTALRAYISSLGSGANAKVTIDKARQVMEKLKKRMADDDQGQQRLVMIFVSLARDLQRQMEIADAAAKKSLGLGFETFLTEVAADATELNTLFWVGDTYRGMGESFGTSLKAMTPEARNYFTKAAATYQKILDRGKKEPGFLPGMMATSVQISLAKTKKNMGDYVGAREMLESILKATPTMLPAQVEAARLYQDWGGTGKGQEDNYLRAIVGARPDKAKNNQNTIWGWGQIATRTANNPQFKDQFYEARYNVALCRYQYALAQTEEAKKKEQLQRSRSDIALTAGLYPELGGEERKRQFDNLLKTIQKALGQRAGGLRDLAQPPAGSNNGTPQKGTTNRTNQTHIGATARR